jgi:hypothetical protein
MVVICIAGVVGAGCAQRVSHDDYQQRITGSDAKVRLVLRELADTDADDVKWHSRTQREVRGLADDLGDTTPPEDAEAAHDAWVDGLSGLARVLSKLSDCARAESTRAGTAKPCRAKITGEELDAVDNDLAQARTLFRAAGYKVEADPE